MNNAPTGLVDQLRLRLLIPHYKDFTQIRPLIAHYTSISVAETILRDRVIWFSNPLFMNDFEEYVYGMRMAEEVVSNSSSIQRLQEDNPAFFDLQSVFTNLSGYYKTNFSLNIFILCFSQHQSDDDDGILSMWRAYGANGSGAALLFDTTALTVVDESPITIAKVNYLSKKQRQEMLVDAVESFCDIVKSAGVEESRACINELFEIMKFFSLTTKDRGFSEEYEWRAIYLPERDHNKVLTERISYWVGPKGIEPKLKLPIRPIEHALGEGIEFEKSLQRILLGPARSSELSHQTFCMMLAKLHLDDWIPKVKSSNIPLRDR